MAADESSRTPCPVGRCAEIVTGKWTLLIVRDLLGGERGFGELQSSLGGISPRTLCQRLELLREHGLVARERIRSVPPRTIYSLTERGQLLEPLVAAMRQVGERLGDAAPDDDAVA